MFAETGCPHTMKVSITTTLKLDSLPLNQRVKLPFKATVMGEELQWAFYYHKTKEDYSCTHVNFMLMCENSLVTGASYTLDFEVNQPYMELEPIGPFQLSVSYDKKIRKVYDKTSLKIRLDSKAGGIENKLTMRKLYNDETGDVEFRCGSLVVKAHKVIVSAHSETLRVAFNSTHCKEGRSGIYTVSREHIEPGILEVSVKFNCLFLQK
jgi:hypothetical protein